MKQQTRNRAGIFVTVFACLLLVVPASAAVQPYQPQQLPLPLLSINKIVLVETGQLYLFSEAPVGYPDESPDFDNAAKVDFATLFPTVASFDAFNASSEADKQQAFLGSLSYVNWDSVSLDPNNMIAQGTVLLDLNATSYSELQTQFEDHIGAMAEAWKWVLQHPFSSGDKPLDVTAMLTDGEFETVETWGAVGRFVGKVASGAWTAGKWVAGKALPVVQAGEFCLTAANVIGTAVIEGEWPAGEDWIELCFDAGECIPYAGVAVALAHEAWCIYDY